MQKFIAEPSFWEILPEASIGIMVVRAMKTADEVSSEDKAAIASILNKANATANQHLTSNTISENEVVAVWRRAYQLFKTKKGARCSIENLLKRVEGQSSGLNHPIGRHLQCHFAEVRPARWWRKYRRFCRRLPLGNR